jgi:hypothetical protein
MAEEHCEGLGSDGALPDVLVAVATRTEWDLGVVDMQARQPAQADQVFEAADQPISSLGFVVAQSSRP